MPACCSCTSLPTNLKLVGQCAACSTPPSCAASLKFIHHRDRHCTMYALSCVSPASSNVCHPGHHVQSIVFPQVKQSTLISQLLSVFLSFTIALSGASSSSATIMMFSFPGHNGFLGLPLPVEIAFVGLPPTPFAGIVTSFSSSDFTRFALGLIVSITSSTTSSTFACNFLPMFFNVDFESCGVCNLAYSSMFPALYGSQIFEPMSSIKQSSWFHALQLVVW